MTGGGGSFSAVWLLPQCPPSPLLQADWPRAPQLWNCFRLLFLCTQFSGLFHPFLLPPLLPTSDSRVDLLSLKAFLVQAVLHSPSAHLHNLLSPSSRGLGRGTKTAPGNPALLSQAAAGEVPLASHSTLEIS